MQYLYLDESGDLGTQFQSSGTSKYLVITVLAIEGEAAKKSVEKAIERTMKNKLRKNPRRRSRYATELKGTNTELTDKRYFYRQIAAVPFNLYAVILDKIRYLDQLQQNPNRVYNFITHLTLKELPLERASTRVTLTIDRSKRKPALSELNAYLLKQLEQRIPPQVPLDINHYDSHESKALQAVDLFAWGIHRKYESQDMKWYDVFREKLAYEMIYPP